MRSFLFLAALLWLSAVAIPADEAKDKPVPSADSIVHDLRDLMPEVEKKTGNPDEAIPAFSVTEGFWAKYKPYDKHGAGCLSRSELALICADLSKTLEEHYPDVFAAIDTDGDEKITNAKLVKKYGVK
jgi:hypothetical protein